MPFVLYSMSVFHSMFVRRAVMVCKEISAKIIGRVAPDCMYVVGIILDIIVFYQESTALQTIVVGLPCF